MSLATDVRELQRLLDSLRHAGNRQYKTQLRYVHDALTKSPRFRAVFEVLAAETASFEVDDWIQKRVLEARQTCHEWPEQENQKLRVLRRLLEVGAIQENLNPTAVGRQFDYSDSLDDWAQAFTRHVVAPLIAYLEASLNDGQDVPHKLERMRRQVEWFEQEKLYEQFRADTGRGEALYDRRVREFLFAEGIDYPYSGPTSPSGRADVVGGLDGDDPLVCEIKLYDAGDYGVPYLRQGVVQALRYARDYGKAVAHLVVFNVSDERIQLPSDEPTSVTPPRLQVEGVTLFMVVVQAKPLPSASKDRNRQVREIQRDQLVPPTDG